MRILFISHNAHRAGAQIVLLNFLKWLKKRHKDIEFDILLGGIGILLKKFELIATTYIIDVNSMEKGRVSRINSRLKKLKTIKGINDNKYDLFFSNTILNGKLLGFLNTVNTPVISYVHEMEYWTSRGGIENMRTILEKTNLFISASKSVKNFLIKTYNITEELIIPVYEPVDSRKVLEGNKRTSLRKILGLQKNSVIIGACGTENFRKGKDWFIPIAVQVLDNLKNEHLHFVWIGGKTSENINFDLIQSGYKANIHFLDQLPDAHNYFHEFSIFLMLSREDPFPIVNLEAGLWGTPILCFENTGGTNELIEDGGGFAVPYANLTAMTNKIIFLIKNENDRKDIGRRLKEKIIANFDIEIVGTSIVNQITTVSN